MPSPAYRPSIITALLFAILAFTGCAKKDSSAAASRGPISFEQNRDQLMESPPTRRYSIANGIGWTEEWQPVDETQKEIVKNPEGHHDCLCTVKFRVKRWDVRYGEKVEPPVERIEFEDRTITVK